MPNPEFSPQIEDQRTGDETTDSFESAVHQPTTTELADHRLRNQFGQAMMDLYRQHQDGAIDDQKASELEERLRRMAKEANIEIGAGLREAKETMDANLTKEEKERGVTKCIGPDEVAKSFGIEVKDLIIPPIPFSQKELAEALTNRQFLILRTDQIPDDKLSLPHTKRTLKKAPETRWALVTEDLMPNSTSKNYLEQTEEIVKYLQEQVFSDRPIQPEYLSAIAEFEAQKEELRPLAESTDETIWKPAAGRLAHLQINQLTRRNQREIIYDSELYKQVNNEYLPLLGGYDWTNDCSDGDLVYVGAFGSGGVDVDGSEPGDAGDDFGVSFSRSL